MNRLLVPCVVILASFYFFPFVPRPLPIANTKLIMAVLGLFLMLYDRSKTGGALFNKNLLIISFFALAVSFVSLLAVVINGKSDFSYVTYIVSMWVWLSAAYLVVRCIQALHGKISIRLVLNYLIAVCVLQCLSAILIQRSAAFSQFCESIVGSLGMAEVGSKTRALSRMHGFSAALDFAGSRFAVIEFCICYLIQVSQVQLANFRL